MWAVALIAAVVGGPFGACLFLAAAVTHFMKIRQVDAQYAKDGKTPPTHRLIEKWLDGRKARGQAPKEAKVAKPGSRAYAKQRWQAFWEDLADKHRETRDQYKQAKADAKANGKPPPPKPTFKETLTGWKWQIDQVAAPVQPTTAPAVNDPHGDDGRTPVTPSPAVAPPTRPDNPTKGGLMSTEQERINEARKNDAHDQLVGFAYNGAASAAKGTTMTASTQAAAHQSGEVTGLQSAINYADAVASAHAAHSQGGGEQYRASLGAAKVGSETIQSAGAAQEASEIAAGAWKTHADKLREQLAAKEATTAETGTKEFLLSE